MGRDARFGTPQITRGVELGAGYDTKTVLVNAEADAQAGVGTSLFGPENKEPRFIHAMNKRALVASHLVGLGLKKVLGTLDRELEQIKASVMFKVHCAVGAFQDHTRIKDRQTELEDRMHRQGLAAPNNNPLRFLAEVLALIPLGIGDVIFTSAIFMILGLDDDKLIGPITELHLASSTAVAALLILARVAGKSLGTFFHAVGAVRGSDAKDRNRLKADLYQSGLESLLSLGALAAVVGGINAARNAYLASEGLGGGPGFLAIQTGIALAGVLVALGFSHPYAKRWKSVTKELSGAEKTSKLTKAAAVNAAGEYNGEVSSRRHLIGTYREWNGAILADAMAKAQEYAAHLLRSQLEPTTDRLLPDVLPAPVSALWVAEDLEGAFSEIHIEDMTLDEAGFTGSKSETKVDQEPTEQSDKENEEAPKSRKRRFAGFKVGSNSGTNGHGRS